VWAISNHNIVTGVAVVAPALLLVLSAAAAAAAGKTLDRDFYMSPTDAREWGLVDSVIEHRPLETAISS
jgi:hypothetical protein